MADQIDHCDKCPGAKSWEELFMETLGKSSRKPFSSTLSVSNQVLELFDNANQFFYLSDYSSLRMLYVSPNIFHVMGYEPNEFDFRVLFEMIHPDDRKAVFEVGKMVLNREMTYISGNTHRHVVLYTTFRAAKKSGRFIWLICCYMQPQTASSEKYLKKGIAGKK